MPRANHTPLPRRDAPSAPDTPEYPEPEQLELPPAQAGRARGFAATMRANPKATATIGGTVALVVTSALLAWGQAGFPMPVGKPDPRIESIVVTLEKLREGQDEITEQLGQIDRRLALIEQSVPVDRERAKADLNSLKEFMDTRFRYLESRNTGSDR